MSDSTDGPADDGSSVDYWQVSFAALAVIGLLLAAFVAPMPAGEQPASQDAEDDRVEEGSGEGDDGSLPGIIGWILQLLFGSDGQSRERGDPACRIALDQEPTPGAEVTVQVTTDGDPVPDAVVWFNDDRVGRTDARGIVTGRVPYSDQLAIRVRKDGLENCAGTTGVNGASIDRSPPAAVTSDPGGVARASAGGHGDRAPATPMGAVATGAVDPGRSSAVATAGAVAGGSTTGASTATRGGPGTGVAAGASALQSDEDDNESVSVEVDGDVEIAVIGRPYPGESVEVVATIDDVPMRRATLSVDGEAVAETDDEGRATITVPEADEIRVGVERGDFAGSRTVDVYLLEATLDPDGLVLVPGGGATVVAQRADEPVDDAAVSVDGERVGTTAGDGREAVTLPTDPTAPVVVSTDRQTTSVSLLGLYWLPVVAFLFLVTASAGLVFYLLGPRPALGVLGVAAGIVVVLVAGGYGGQWGALAALAAFAGAGVLAALVRYRRQVAGGVTTAGGLLAALVERVIALALWVVGGLESAIDSLLGALSRCWAWLRSMPRSVTGIAARLFRAVRSLLERIAVGVRANPLVALAPVVAVPVVSGAYWYDGVRGGVLAGAVVGLVGAAAAAWWVLARDGEAGSAADATGDEPGTPGPEAPVDPVADGNASWTVRQLWRAFASRVVPRRWRTSAPDEVARQAVRNGYPAGPVRTLATAFREVEYGNRSAPAVARERVRAAYDALVGGATEADGNGDSLDDTTTEGEAS